MLRTARNGSAAALITGLAGYSGYLYSNDEGTRRGMKAYGMMIPVVFKYRFLEAQKRIRDVSEEEWLALDNKYAAPVVERLGELQGMYTKYGQTCAGLTNTFSETWIKELRKLEDKVPPRSADVVIKTIETETGKPLSETFVEFDHTPLGSASIGQVHRAVLRSNGQEVAVKVQYPESEATFRSDIVAIRGFCSYLAPEHIVTMSALEKQNAAEIDYTNEASNLTQVSQNMIQAGFQPREAVVPRAIPSISTKRMLVMELLPGPKLNDGVRSYYSSWAKQNGTTLEKLEADAKRKIEEEGIPAKYDGPTAEQLERYRQFLQKKNTILNAGIVFYNYTVGLLPTVKRIDYRQLSEMPPNTPRIVDTLMRVHGHQLLKNGLFNADPHGGNFLLMPDGRIGLIDYGATKSLTEKERISACVMYAALHRNDEEMLYNMSTIGGYKSKHGRRDVLMKLMQFGYNSYGKDVTGNMNVQQFIDDLKKKDPWTETPDNFVMASFMSIRLRSVALGMNHPVKCSDWWGPMAEQILKEEGHPYESWDHDKLVEHKPEINVVKQSWS